MAGRNPKLNASGSPDPTAYAALKPMIQNESKIEKKVRKFVHCIHSMAELVGFEVSGSFSIKDKRTGIKIKRNF